MEQQPDETTTTTTTTMDTETSSPLFGASKPSRGWQSRKRSSGSKKAKSAEAHGSSLAAAEFAGPAEEAIVAKPSKHHSGTTKSSSVPDLPPMQPPPPDAPPLESKVVTSDRSCGFKRHQHVPSAPVQSPETGGDHCLPRSMAPAVVDLEQPYATPSKKMPDHIAAESAEAPPSEAKGVANDHLKATKSHHHAPVAPAQSPDSGNLETRSPPSDAVPFQEPPTASNKRMPEQPAPAASDRLPETQHQHSALVPINVPVSEPMQLSTPTDASTDLWLVPLADSLPAIAESPNRASGSGSASVPFEVDVAPPPQHAAQQQPQKAAPGGCDADSVLSPKSPPGSSTIEATGFKRGLICAIIIGFLILLLIFVLPLGPPRPKISSTVTVGPPSSSPLL